MKKRMAKVHSVRPLPPPTVTAEPSAVVLTVGTRKLVEAIRDDFGVYAENFKSVMVADRAALAPRFMKAFAAWSDETSGTFVAFVRSFDASVPEDRDGYKAHSTYQAADYLRRKDALMHRGAEQVPAEERPVSLYDSLAFLVATLLPIVDPNGTIWNAFVKEVRWTEESATRLRERALKLGAVKLPPRTKHSLEGLAKAS